MANEDLLNLISNRVSELDKRRERQQQRTIYVFCGEQVPGEIADPPSGKNVRVMKEGDELPANRLHVTYNAALIRFWYDAYTKRTGPNVRRWKTLAEMLSDNS